MQKTKPKILFVTYSLAVGGTERVLVNLLDKIKDQYEIEIAILVNKTDMLAAVPEGIKVTPLFDDININPYTLVKIWAYSRNPKWIQDLYRRKLTGDYDVEVAFSDWGGCPSFVAFSPNEKAKKVAWLHFDAKVFDYKVYGFIPFARTMQLFDEIVGVSNTAEESARELFPILSDKLSTIHNLMRVEDILVKAENEANPFAQTKDSLNLLAVGRMYPQKGFERLIQAHKKLIDQGFRYHLHFVGEGIEQKPLELAVKTAGLSEYTTFWGVQKNPYKFMRNADLFVLSSRYEGLPTVCIEAFLCGTPIVSTEVAGIYEIFKGQEVGLITENSTDGVYRGLKSALENPEQLAVWKQNVQQYTWHNEFIIDEIHILFNK
ncbi:MAG: glycosyltransferase [Culicoidibacterales bacterium]